MQGRTCLITGANTGIGKAAALGLAQQGATLLLVCRDRARGEAARDEIARQTGSDSLELLIADLSSLEEVRRLAAEVRGQHAAIHVLVNNAGVHLGDRSTTADGIETTFAVNHLSHFLLANLLLDLLEASAPARIVVVASDRHRGVSLELDSLRDPTSYHGDATYRKTKLANIMFTYELARRLGRSDNGGRVTVNAMHPGHVATGMFSTNSPLLKPGFAILRRFLLSPEQGADTVVYLASSPAVAGVSGSYFIKRRPVRSSEASYDQTTQSQLWEMSAELTRL
jgi:NAD(P)-dependent dehydrogenase (short-subunit alcohol dehydrogenase family)